MNLDALVTAREASAHLGVSIQLICMWRNTGWIDPETQQRVHLQVRGRRGRSPLYRWGDVLTAERDTRRKTDHSHRKPRPAAA